MLRMRADYLARKRKVSNKKQKVSKSAESLGRLVSVGECTVVMNVCKHKIRTKGY